MSPNSEEVTSVNNNIEKQEVLLDIITTNKLIYNMTKEIVKDKHRVSYMFEDFFIAQHYMYGDFALETVAKKDLFIYSGSGAEPWVSDFVNDLKKGKVGIINLSRGARTLNYDEPHLVNGIDNKINPYYWLSIDDMKVFLYNIKSSIQERDPENRDFYEQNYEKLIELINAKDEIIKTNKVGLNNYNIYLLDENLEYLMKYLGVNYTKLQSAFTEEEGKKISESIAKDNNLFIYSDVSQFDKYKNLVSEKKFVELPIQIPNYSDNYFEFLDKLGQKLDTLNIKVGETKNK